MLVSMRVLRLGSDPESSCERVWDVQVLVSMVAVLMRCDEDVFRLHVFVRLRLTSIRPVATRGRLVLSLKGRRLTIVPRESSVLTSCSSIVWWMNGKPVLSEMLVPYECESYLVSPLRRDLGDDEVTILTLVDDRDDGVLMSDLMMTVSGMLVV